MWRNKRSIGKVRKMVKVERRVYKTEEVVKSGRRACILNVDVV